MKTGDCKFGASCRFHHPPDWAPRSPSAPSAISYGPSDIPYMTMAHSGSFSQWSKMDPHSPGSTGVHRERVALESKSNKIALPLIRIRFRFKFCCMDFCLLIEGFRLPIHPCGETDNFTDHC
ncbi:hypothetical protein L1987_60401 [Smallanthus sonchifolius]|uniref:Uncharacterized protein n=1 Tax=Smallanthus sonchifolius TaxID=185202 RepID=A0ACB9D8C6_9ASTR|nr:hypothetical protein L1987_60401 [Smallanthus sonchifolius]